MITHHSKNTSQVNLLRFSISAVYIWFGALKFFPELSPADQIAKQTIHYLTMGLLPDATAIILLAIIECSLGLLLIFKKMMRFTIWGVLIHLVLTFSPFLLFPADTFQFAPYGFTLLGQYIFKNIILISAAWMIWQSERRPSPVAGERQSGQKPEPASFSKKSSKKVIFH